MNHRFLWFHLHSETFMSSSNFSLYICLQQWKIIAWSYLVSEKGLKKSSIFILFFIKAPFGTCSKRKETVCGLRKSCFVHSSRDEIKCWENVYGWEVAVPGSSRKVSLHIVLMNLFANDQAFGIMSRNHALDIVQDFFSYGTVHYIAWYVQTDNKGMLFCWNYSA